MSAKYIWVVTSEGISSVAIHGVFDTYDNAKSVACVVEMEDVDTYHDIFITRYPLNSYIKQEDDPLRETIREGTM